MGVVMPRLAWIVLLSFVTLLPSLHAQPKASKEEPINSENNSAKIKAILDRVVEVEEVKEIQIRELLKDLAEKNQIPLVLDPIAFIQLAADEEPQVSIAATKDKVRSILKKILTPYQLTFGQVGDQIIVTSEESLISRQYRQKVDLNINEEKFGTVLKKLSRQYGVNLVLDPRTAATKTHDKMVTLEVEEVPLETAIRLLTEMAGAKPVLMGNVLFITTEERAEKLRDSDSLIPIPNNANTGFGNLPLIVPNPPFQPQFAAPAAAPAPPVPPKKEEAKKSESKEDLPPPPEKK
jgi:hypothetical protein